jgi:hypothetical protein
MAEKQINPINLLIDTFWALLPEKTADELANLKKFALISARDTLSWVVTKEIEWTDKHLENARKMRERYQQPQENQTGGAEGAPGQEAPRS